MGFVHLWLFVASACIRNRYPKLKSRVVSYIMGGTLITCIRTLSLMELQSHLQTYRSWWDKQFHAMTRLRIITVYVQCWGIGYCWQGLHTLSLWAFWSTVIPGRFSRPVSDLYHICNWHSHPFSIWCSCSSTWMGLKDVCTDSCFCQYILQTLCNCGRGYWLERLHIRDKKIDWPCLP